MFYWLHVEEEKMNHISKFVYALIIFLSIYVVVLDGRK